MALNSAIAYHGLQGTAALTGQGVSGTAAIGTGQTATTLSAATQAVTFRVEVDGSYDVDIDLTTLVPTVTGAGQAQVETATVVAAAGATSDGNLTVTVTGSSITGSPLTVLVPLTTATHTTATLIAVAIRDALDLVIDTNEWIPDTTGAEVSMTRAYFATNDATMNIAIAAGLGVTAAPTSANTTAGLAPAKCYRLTGTTWAGEDFEGADPGTPATYYGLEIAVSGAAGVLVAAGNLADQLGDGEVFHKHAAGGLDASFVPGDNLAIDGNGGFVSCLVTLLFSTS